MKRILSLSLALLWAGALASAAEWTGWIADQKCAEAGKAASDGHAGCAKKCIEAGEEIVFVDAKDGKVYELMPDEDTDLEEFAGKKVVLNGDADENVIEITSIKPAS